MDDQDQKRTSGHGHGLSHDHDHEHEHDHTAPGHSHAAGDNSLHRTAPGHSHAPGDHAHDHSAPGHSHDKSHNHAHGDGHGHGHDHGILGHHHSTISNLKLALAINLAFSLVELVGGVWTGSVAVMSNAVHDLSDAFALGLAYIMEVSANRRPNARYSYGYRRLSLLSALFTCVVLIGAAAFVISRAIPLLLHPETPKLEGMAGFAFLGVAVNAFAAWRLARGKTINERVASWHMVQDVLGWVSVLVGSLVMMFVDLPIIDPLLSVLISLFILGSVAPNLYKTLRLFLQATPEGIDLQALRREIEGLTSVVGTHDAHLWSLDGLSHVLTIHVVVSGDVDLQYMDTIKIQIRKIVASRGDIHVTVEMEAADSSCGGGCDPASAV